MTPSRALMAFLLGRDPATSSGSGNGPKHKPRIVRMSKSALAAVVADKIWTLERPVWFSGVRLRARTYCRPPRRWRFARTQSGASHRCVDGAVTRPRPRALAGGPQLLSSSRDPCGGGPFPRGTGGGAGVGAKKKQGIETSPRYQRPPIWQGRTRIRDLATSGRAVSRRSGALS